MILGDSYITFNTKLSNFRGHYVPLESKFRGHLKQKRAKSPFFEGQGKPWNAIFQNNNLRINTAGHFHVKLEK